MNEHAHASGLALFEKLNVMIVDPDTEQRIGLKNRLTDLDLVHMVGTRSTPHFLVDVFNEANVDLIVFDGKLGWENISDSVRELKAHPYASKTGFLYVTDSLGRDNIKQCAELGILGCLQRPYDDAKLKQAIRIALGEVDPAKEPVLKAMRKQSFFRKFSDRDLVRLLNMCDSHYKKEGEVIFKEGEPGESLFILLSGRVDIVKEIDGQRSVLNSIQPGRPFGEMAILDNDPRLADAVAGEASMVFEITKKVATDDESDLALKLSRQISIELANKIRSFNYR